MKETPDREGSRRPRELLVTARFPPAHVARLREAAGEAYRLTLCPQDGDQEALREALSRAEVVIGEPPLSLLRESRALGWVQMTWAGTDAYTRAALPFPAGVRLTNASGAFGGMMSQYALGQALSLMQNLPGYLRQQEAGVWRDLGEAASLEGATVLIFGAGNIGGETARRLQGFRTRTVGVCRDTARPRPWFDALCTLEEAEDWLPQADVVIGCIPNAGETVHYLNRRRLERMKPGAVLVNMGRGSFVDCGALAQVLAEGRLRGAALDVTEPEPLPPGHPLWAMTNCVITPHVSGRTEGRRVLEEAVCGLCCDNLRRWRRGEALRNVIY